MLLSYIFVALFVITLSDDSIVITQYGPIQGNVTILGRAFTSIPYAKPPIGDLRWKKPISPISWTSILETKSDPPHCIQKGRNSTEDCLYLNVFTPPVSSTSSSSLAVMIFIHGGAFSADYSGGSLYNGTNMASLTNTIIVTINYRLGVMGFLYDDDNGLYGNYGYFDQKFAIKWTYDNIEAFGGNNELMTIYGQSAGAVSVALHLCDLTETPYFNTVIMESEPMGFALRDENTWKGVINDLYQYLGCNDRECLYNCSSEKILSAQNKVSTDLIRNGFIFEHIHMLWTPTVGVSSEIKNQPLWAFNHGEYHSDINIINGVNKNEFAASLMVKDEYEALITVQVGIKNREKVLNEYPMPINATPSQYQNNMALIMTDMLFKCGNHNISKAISAQSDSNNNIVYLYHFDHISSFNKYIYPPIGHTCYNKSCHGAELYYVFKPDLNEINNNAEYSEEEYLLAKQMEWYWATMAINGNPGNGQSKQNGLIQWKQYNTKNRETMIFNTGSLVIQNDYDDNHCDFWDSLNWDWIPNKYPKTDKTFILNDI